MEAVAEQPVKVTTTANKGYQLDEVKVIDANGKILAVSNSEFIMPSSDVTVYVTFEADTLDETPSTGNNLLVLIPAGLVFIMTIIIILDKRYKDI